MTILSINSDKINLKSELKNFEENFELNVASTGNSSDLTEIKSNLHSTSSNLKKEISENLLKSFKRFLASKKETHSKSSNVDRKNKNFDVSYVLNNLKTPSILKNNFLIVILQISFFLSINIIFIILISNQFSSFKNSIQKMSQINYFSNAFSESMLASDIYYLNSLKIIKNISNINDLYESISFFNNNSYQKVQIFKTFFNANNFRKYYEDKVEIIEIYFQQMKKIINIKLDQFIAKYFDINYKMKHNNSINFDSYMFLRCNFIKVFQVFLYIF